jgi:predicted aminopeptidase
MVISAVIMLFSGCYLLKQGTYLLKYQCASRPVIKVLTDSSVTSDERDFFYEIDRIRAFAVDSIGLKRTKNYTRYVVTDSSYLLAMLSAADSASFKTKKWCYPFFGCFPLRSYYCIEDAKKVADRMAAEGYETDIQKVDGFSTLGIFSDPLFSFMKDYSAFALTNFIFHELTHATVYFGKDVQFSEELAVFVALEGSLWYLRVYYGEESEEYRKAIALNHDHAVYLSLLRNLYKGLDTLYSSELSRDVKIARKKSIVSDFKDHLKNDYDSIFASQRFRGIEKLSFNNAFLAVRMTYTLDLDIFIKLYEQKEKNLKQMLQFVVSMKKRKGLPKAILREEVNRQGER